LRDLAEDGSEDRTSTPDKRDAGSIPQVAIDNDTACTVEDAAYTTKGAVLTESATGTIPPVPTWEDVGTIRLVPTEEEEWIISPADTEKDPGTFPPAHTKDGARPTP
jgi:hypothetical protein